MSVSSLVLGASLVLSALAAPAHTHVRPDAVLHVQKHIAPATAHYDLTPPAKVFVVMCPAEADELPAVY